MKSVLPEAKQNQVQNCIGNFFKYSQHILRDPNAKLSGPLLLYIYIYLSLVPTQKIA